MVPKIFDPLRFYEYCIFNIVAFVLKYRSRAEVVVSFSNVYHANEEGRVQSTASLQNLMTANVVR